MRQQFLVDIADTFKTYVYENNRKVVPSSATITVYKPGTTDKLVDAQAMSVAGDGLLSYSLTTTHNDIADLNYKAVISYVVGGVTSYLTLYYDIVNSKLLKTIIDDDLVNELPQLKGKQWTVHGTAESGSTTTIVDTELKNYEDDYFTGGLATNLTTGEAREISDFVSSSGTVTTTTFATANAVDHKYMIQRSFSKEIQRAFEKLETLISQSGRRAHMILDPYDVRDVHIYLSVAEVCKGLVAEQDNMWAWFKDDYEKKAHFAFKALNFKYDDSDDGYISGAEESRPIKKTLARA